MADRELQLPSDEDVARDRELLEALDDHQSVGEKYARAGEVPLSVEREPSMRPSANAELLRDPTPVKPLPSPPRLLGRRILQVCMVLFLVGVGYFLVSFWQVWSSGRSDEARSVDAIVVMGAAQYDGRPSPQLAARLDHAVDLWNEGLAPVVVVTGGNQEGDRFTEASASAAYLIDRGVASSAIVQEDAGSTTFDSLERAQTIVGDSVQTVLVVTDPYHALRTELTAEEVGFTAYASPAPDSVVRGAAELRRELAEAAGVAVGRIIGFERLSGLTD
ncbi:MAG TPA: YdcF family protein [Ilumatobacteraceae bacterium]|nr:YdcF family protein [Ilumatobacteraceae bacterium]